jgi:hypothetical protein
LSGFVSAANPHIGPLYEYNGSQVQGGLVIKIRSKPLQVPPKVQAESALGLSPSCRYGRVSTGLKSLKFRCPAKSRPAAPGLDCSAGPLRVC